MQRNRAPAATTIPTMYACPKLVAALAEVERLREVIRTIRARCVELDDSDAVSATLDITSAVLDSKP